MVQDFAEAHDEAFASGFGDLTVHEVAVDPDEANRFYSSYYDAGLRAFQIKGGKIVETGGYIDPNGDDFWGVETFVRDGRTIILGSDRDRVSGLPSPRASESGLSTATSPRARRSSKPPAATRSPSSAT